MEREKKETWRTFNKGRVYERFRGRRKHVREKFQIWKRIAIGRVKERPPGKKGKERGHPSRQKGKNPTSDTRKARGRDIRHVDYLPRGLREEGLRHCCTGKRDRPLHGDGKKRRRCGFEKLTTLQGEPKGGVNSTSSKKSEERSKNS